MQEVQHSAAAELPERLAAAAVAGAIAVAAAGEPAKRDDKLRDAAGVEVLQEQELPDGGDPVLAEGPDEVPEGGDGPVREEAAGGDREA